MHAKHDSQSPELREPCHPPQGSSPQSDANMPAPLASTFLWLATMGASAVLIAVRFQSLHWPRGAFKMVHILCAVQPPGP